MMVNIIEKIAGRIKTTSKMLSLFLILTLFYTQIGYANTGLDLGEKANAEIQIYLEGKELFVKNILHDRYLDIKEVKSSNGRISIIGEAGVNKIASGEIVSFMLEQNEDKSIFGEERGGLQYYRDNMVISYITEDGDEKILIVELYVKKDDKGVKYVIKNGEIKTGNIVIAGLFVGVTFAIYLVNSCFRYQGKERDDNGNKIGLDDSGDDEDDEDDDSGEGDGRSGFPEKSLVDSFVKELDILIGLLAAMLSNKKDDYINVKLLRNFIEETKILDDLLNRLDSYGSEILLNVIDGLAERLENSRGSYPLRTLILSVVVDIMTERLQARSLEVVENNNDIQQNVRRDVENVRNNTDIDMQGGEYNFKLVSTI